MDAAQVTRMVSRASDPSLIAGIHNYCDRCCHRCAFTQRCLTYLDAQDQGRDVDEPLGSPGEVVKASLARALEMMRVFAEQHGIVITTRPGEEEALVREEE